MICGISRLSVRYVVLLPGSVAYKKCSSIAATATFFATGVITTRIMPEDLQPSTTIVDWTLGTRGIRLLALQAIPLFLNLWIYALVGYFIPYTDLTILIPFSNLGTVCGQTNC